MGIKKPDQYEEAGNAALEEAKAVSDAMLADAISQGYEEGGVKYALHMLAGVARDLDPIHASVALHIMGVSSKVMLDRFNAIAKAQAQNAGFGGG